MRNNINNNNQKTTKIMATKNAKTVSMNTVIKNIESVMASAKNDTELKNYGNSISKALKSAYEKRVAEIAAEIRKAAEKASAKAEKAKKAEKKAEKKTAVKKTEKKTAKAEAPKIVKVGGEEVEQIALTDTKALKKLGLKFVPYSEKCVLLVGNTKPIYKEMKKLSAAPKSGVFGNMHLKAVKGFDGGFGWLVNKDNKNYAKVAEKLHLKAI